MFRRAIARVIVSAACVLGIAALLACGDDELCDTECVGGRLQQVCCKTGEVCPDIAPFCDRGSGVCTDGDCTPGSDDASTDANVDAGLVCGSSTCNAGEVCVQTQRPSGACLLPDDAGTCPDGLPPTGPCCNSAAATYACKPLPATCNGVLTCPCANLCETGCTCDVAAPDLACTCTTP
ncbi:MAG TPA: hypothetical protein VIF62_21915 [Labilithrix sp.]